MSIKRYSESNFIDVSNYMRYDGTKWVGVENKFRYDGSGWIKILGSINPSDEISLSYEYSSVSLYGTWSKRYYIKCNKCNKYITGIAQTNVYTQTSTGGTHSIDYSIANYGSNGGCGFDSNSQIVTYPYYAGLSIPMSSIMGSSGDYITKVVTKQQFKDEFDKCLDSYPYSLYNGLKYLYDGSTHNLFDNGYIQCQYCDK